MLDLEQVDELVQWRQSTKTRVVHIRHEQNYTVYIGRPGNGQTSIWGNPYRLNGEAQRGSTLANYRSYLARQDHLMARLDELKGEVLGCFCHPRPCHGHILAELADMTPAERKQWQDAVLATED